MRDVLTDALIATREGPMRAIVAAPQASGPFWPVILFPHVGGLTDTMRTMARTVASGGYVCVVPDLYHRLGTLVLDPQSSDDRVVAIRKIAAASITTSGAMQDTRAVLDWLGNQDHVRASSCGTLGFGRGGSLALQAAATYPDQIRAASSVLGFGYTAESRDAAVALFRTLTAGVYCAFAGRDDIIPASEQDELSYVLAKAHVNAEIVVHPNARHPYIFPDRIVFDGEAAHRDWDAIFRLFSRFLGPRE